MMFNSANFLSNISIGARPVKSSSIKYCRWFPPPTHVTKICSDGVARRNPGQAGARIIIRDHNSSTLATIAMGLGICSNFIAEVVAILLGIEWAVENHKGNIWVVSDSMAAIKAFKDNKIPLFARNRWNSVKNLFQQMKFSHSFREVNFAADALAK
ncbi:Ribonuclease H domain [Macleaya cordata]|uniref:Ribonuclease H domain n=1 Tax=Macleaya cordata TaxID=56857 RepID=A0A200QC52_MACCD|nr:Ribonuclease H domain [Macleaya cordata]